MSTIIVYPNKPEEVKSLKSILKLLNISFKTIVNSNTFEAKIKQARKEKATGKLKTINPENIWESIS